MPTYYENSVAQTEVTLTEQEYAQAWVLYQSRFGRMRNRTLKTVLCLLAAVLSGFYLPTYAAQYTTFWIPLAVILIALMGAVYYQILLPRQEMQHGCELFQSSRFLQATATIQLYRDSYQEENQWEKIVGHWTDMQGCGETETLFVAMGGWDRQLLVIPKRVLSAETIDVLHEHFQNTFVERFQKTKN